MRKKSIRTGKIVKPTKDESDYFGVGGIIHTSSALPTKTAGDWAGMEGESKQLGYYKPRWTSPLLSWTNYYIPWDRATLMQWCRFYDTFHPLVGNAIDLHTQMPLSRFVLKGIKDKKVLRFFEQTLEQMDAFMLMYSQLREYWLIGENFTYLNWDEDMGTFTDGELLMPEYIEVRGHPFVRGETEGSYAYFLIPDEGIRAFINSPDESCQELKGKIPMEIRQAVEEEKNIRISNFNLMVLMRKQARYNPRGTSIILRCLKDLLYEDKLREAQYAIADRHVLPKEIWKIGNEKFLPNKTKMRAFRNLIRDAEDQPKFTLVTHYAVNYEIQGATGKFPQLTTEFEWVENRILTALFTNKALTHGEGPCHLPIDSDGNPVEVLTQRGFVHWDDVADGEAIASFNPETEQLEFQVPVNRIIRDYDGEVVDFCDGHIDLSATANHRMWVQDSVGEWKIIPASDVKPSYHLRCDMKPQTGDSPEKVVIEGFRQHRFDEEYEAKKIDIPIDDYLAFAGYYVSEGSLDYEHRYGESRPSGVTLSQIPESKNYTKMSEDLNRLPFNVSFHGKDRFRISDRLFADKVLEEFGQGAASKRLPSWIKQLPADKLEIIIAAMLVGDGHQVNDDMWEYYTISEQLSKDFQEITFRAGYATSVRCRERSGNRQRQYRCRISKNESSKIGRTPILRDAISKRHYTGKVWCFEVPPNELFVVRSGGKVYITGNTYANASIATRAMMMRYIPVRSQLEDVWKTKVFLPIAIEHGFYKISEAELSHKVRTRKNERELTVPEFDWRWKSNLLDDQNVRDMIKGMVGEGQLPMKSLIDMLGMDYDNILEWRKREEGTVFDPLYAELRKAAQKEGMDVTKGASVSKPAINRRLNEMRAATKQLIKAESKLDKPREFDFLSRGGLNRKIKAASLLLHKGEADVVKFLLGTGKDNIVTLTSKTSEADAKRYMENMKRDRKDSL